MKLFAQSTIISLVMYFSSMSAVLGLGIFVLVLFRDVIAFQIRSLVRFIIVIALQKRSQSLSISKAVELCAKLTDFDRKQN
jgi:hypothetical protein